MTFSRNGSGRSYIFRSWQPQAEPLPPGPEWELGRFSSRVEDARAGPLCHAVGSAPPSGPGFAARRAPGAETGVAEAFAAGGGGGGGDGVCVCVRRPHRARAPQGSRAPCSPGSVRPEPSRRHPARSRPEPPAPGPATAGRGLFPRPASSGLQPRRNIPGSPRPVAPVPAPPPPRVFRPSKDRATQISLGCPLPSGPFSGRVSGAAKSLVFSPKWKVWGAGAAGAASNCSARSNSCQ